MDDCKGCILKDKQCVTRAIFRDSNDKEYKCPCMICLVKMTCADPCEEFQQYLKDYYDFMKGDLSEYVQYFGKIIGDTKHGIAYMRGVPMYMKFQDVPPLETSPIIKHMQQFMKDRENE